MRTITADRGKRFELVRANGAGEIEIRVKPGAELDVVLFSEPAAGAAESVKVRAFVHEDARLNVLALDLGPGRTERNVEVSFEGPGGFASLKGLAVLSGEAAVKNGTVVHHKSPRTTSRQVFKEVLAGKSTAEYDGLVHVHRGAVQSDSDQLNRNLLLSDDARAASRPQLKIDADDVKAAHGSTTGQLPPEEIFYMRSRGLDPRSARAVWMKGFADEILHEIPDADARREIEAKFHRELEKVS